MNCLSKIDVFDIALTLWQLLGEDTRETSTISIITRVVNCAVQIFLIIFIVANFWNASGGAYVNTLENFTTVFHTLFKYSLFIYYKKDLMTILHAKSAKFWSSEKCQDKNLTREIENIYKTKNIVQLAMFGPVTIIVYISFLKPFLNPTNVFILESNVFMDSLILEILLLACQYYYFCIIALIGLGYDGIYLSLCVDLAAQLKYLKQKLRKVFTNTDDINRDIGVCIEQHTFLLSVYEQIQRMYSITLLFHYFVTLLTACFDMYQSFVSHQSIHDEILKFMSLCAIIGQFAFYSIPAELISSEFSDVSDAMYMSNWYESGPETQKMMILVALKAQRKQYLSAAGFLDINIDAFGSVFRKAFSFYAIIRRVLDK